MFSMIYTECICVFKIIIFLNLNKFLKEEKNKINLSGKYKYMMLICHIYPSAEIQSTFQGTLTTLSSDKKLF